MNIHFTKIDAFKVIIIVLLTAGILISILFWYYALVLFQPINILIAPPTNNRKLDLAVSAISSITVAYVLVNFKWSKPS